MSRPKITSSLFAQLVEQAPGRVRKRLDSEPSIANQWNWTVENQVCSIQCNEETVRLRPSDDAEGVVSSLSEVECSCLLSPKCFHLLACCSVLEIQETASLDNEIARTAAKEPDASGELDDAFRWCGVSEGMRAAARNATKSIERLLAIGARNAGMLLQTELLRASHLCRAEEFVTLSNSLVSVVEGVRRVRSQSDEADATTLRDDIVYALWVSLGAMAIDRIPSWMIGQTRRRYTPVQLKKLSGVLAEPILSRSGYAGVSVLLRENHQGELYSINEIRPGNEELVHQAYLGGIDLGGLMVDAKTLCRGTYSVQGMMASQDGRLGKGKASKWGRTKSQSSEEFTSEQSLLPLGEQIAKLKRYLEVSSDVRPAGWDMLEVAGVILGASGDCLIVDMGEVGGVWRFAMPMDSPHLEYRPNFQLLARCKGLRLCWHIRLRFEAAQTAEVVAVRNFRKQNNVEQADEVRLELPEDWNGVCNVGLDRLERQFAFGIQSRANELDGREVGSIREESMKFVQSIERRLIGIALGGIESVPELGSKTLQRDCTALRRLGLTYGAVLLEQLSSETHGIRVELSLDAHGRRDNNRGDSFSLARNYLACAKYIEGFKYSLVIDPLLELAGDRYQSTDAKTY